MQNLKQLMMLTLLTGGFALLSGCADTNPTDPFEELSLTAAFAKGGNGGGSGSGDGGGSGEPVVLQWIKPLAQDITVEADCDYASGCVLEIPEVGAQLQIGGATLPGPMKISMTALAGTDVNFVFGPHGTQFKKQVTVRVDYKLTSAADRPRGDFYALYWTPEAGVIDRLTAEVKKGWLQFTTDHFSGYALAM